MSTLTDRVRQISVHVDDSMVADLLLSMAQEIDALIERVQHLEREVLVPPQE